MERTITIRLPAELRRLVDRAAKQSGQTRSIIVRHALQRQLALLRFEQLRSKVLQRAQRQGYLTDEDVFRRVS